VQLTLLTRLYNDPAWPANRHEISGLDGPLAAMTKGLGDIAAKTINAVT